MGVVKYIILSILIVMLMSDITIKIDSSNKTEEKNSLSSYWEYDSTGIVAYLKDEYIHLVDTKNKVRVDFGREYVDANYIFNPEEFDVKNKRHELALKMSYGFNGGVLSDYNPNNIIVEYDKTRGCVFYFKSKSTNGSHIAKLSSDYVKPKE